MFATSSWTIHPIDIAIVGIYFVGVVVSGVVLARRARQNIDSYFLGGRSIPWYLLGVSNASGMFDITGTMWAVMLMFVYGLKSVWIPWVWPTFNQIFLMIFLSAWLRRSNVLTGAEWLRTRFGGGKGHELAHISVVVFAIITVISYLGYAFVGIGKFATVFLPWDLSPNTYAITIMAGTACYVVAGGMYSVVLTDLVQFLLLTIASIAVGSIAIANTTVAEINEATPEGWSSIGFGWNLGIDWSGKLDFANETVADGNYQLFTVFMMMAVLKGVLSSIAGPTPNYDMQRILATRSPRESCLMSAIVSPILYVPRYFLIAGITVLGLVYYSETLAELGDAADFEQVLPYVMQNFLPVGLKGILLAGLFAAFMSTFDSTINAGAAYLVNDIYKRHLRTNQSSVHYVKASYVASMVIVVVGAMVGVALCGADGWQTEASKAAAVTAGTAAIANDGWSIDEFLQWFTGGLFGGYIAPNLLKWIWWRLNGYGYFAGMIAGIVAALSSLSLKAYVKSLIEESPEWAATLQGWLPLLEPLNMFPIIFLISGCIAIIASKLTPADDEEVIETFYSTVRPWGFWEPIKQRLQSRDPSFRGNDRFGSDMGNCAVGALWQVGLTAFPIFVVLRDWTSAAGSLVVIAVTTVFLKFKWYDQLPPATDETG